MKNITTFDFNMDKSNNYVGIATCPICGIDVEYHSFEDACSLSTNCIHLQRIVRVNGKEKTQLQAIFSDN